MICSGLFAFIPGQLNGGRGPIHCLPPLADIVTSGELVDLLVVLLVVVLIVYLLRRLL